MNIQIIGTKNNLEIAIKKNLDFEILKEENLNTEIEVLALMYNENFEKKIDFEKIKCKYFLVDSDLDLDYINYFKNKIEFQYILTFGSNLRATITFSSIESTEKADYQICVQKSFNDFAGNLIYPQEFLVECFNKNLNSNDILLISTLMLLVKNEVQDII